MCVAREITEESAYVCSINLTKDYILLTILLDDNNISVVTMVYFHKDKYFNTKEFKGLYDVKKHLPRVHFGKYLNMISQSYVNCDKSEKYFEF